MNTSRSTRKTGRKSPALWLITALLLLAFTLTGVALLHRLLKKADEIVRADVQCTVYASPAPSRQRVWVGADCEGEERGKPVSLSTIDVTRAIERMEVLKIPATCSIRRDGTATGCKEVR